MANPKNKIELIYIDTKDEFGKMARFTSKSIRISLKFYKGLSKLLQFIDKNVMICEFDESENVIGVT